MIRSQNPLLMGASPAGLRLKLTAKNSPLENWWRHFLTLARQDSVWFSPYTVLAAVVTGEERDREAARNSFLRFVELKDEGYASLDAQYHTHVVTAPLGRWAIYYDWVADLGLFTPEEDAAIRAAIIDYAFVFALQNLQSRMRTFENQILSSAFCAASVGYVFGLKRGNSALARRLYNDGIAWLQELLKRLPEGGYHPEGSAYHEFVVLPLVILSALLIEETTGQNVCAVEDSLTQGKFRRLLETSHRMISPSGLMPAWDAYGFHAASVKSGLAFLAKITGDAAPLETMRQLNMWQRSSLSAWEVDDRLWTLVWWPEKSNQQQSPLFASWMQPQIGGALQDEERRLRLFQYWDECGGLPSSGRYQVDPNAITLEAYGSPLLLDGSGRPNAEVLSLVNPRSREYVGRRTLETVKEYGRVWGELKDDEALATALDGSVGMSNSLIIDDEAWYVPKSPQRGEGQALHDVGPLKVLRSDATAYYRDRYDVVKVNRTSALIDGRYLLVSDTLECESSHNVTWQAYVRREVAQEQDRVVIITPEHIRCDVIFLQPGETSVTPVEGYPAQPDAQSMLVQHRIEDLRVGRLDVALVPQLLRKPLQDLTDCWERHIGPLRDVVSLNNAYLSDPFEPAHAPRIFKRTFQMDAITSGRSWLTIQTANPQTGLTVNGVEVPAALQQDVASNWKTGQMLEWVFDITAAIKTGANELVITAPFFHGESVCGPIWLHAERTPRAVRVQREAAGIFAVTQGDKTDVVLLEGSGQKQAWCDGETDARYAVRTHDGTVAAADVTFLSLPGTLTLESEQPCDFSWSPEEMRIEKMTAGTFLEARWEDAYLRVEAGGCVTVTYQGNESYRLHVTPEAARTVLVNGHVQETSAAFKEPLVLTPEVNTETASVDDLPGEIYRRAEKQGKLALDFYVQALHSEDWRAAIAAADVIGSLVLTAAVPDLLEVFAFEEAVEEYPSLSSWWKWSKMLRNADAKEGPDPSSAAPNSVKRWRVKRAVVTALGKLGDARAVAPLEVAMERGDDFFHVTSQLAVALGRLGAPGSIPILERNINHAEVNTRAHARLALALLKNEIDRAEFEARVGLN